MIISKDLISELFQNGWTIYNLNNKYIFKLLNKSENNNIDIINYGLDQINKFDCESLNNNTLSKIKKFLENFDIHCEIYISSKNINFKY